MKFGVLTMIFFGGEGLKSVSRRRGRLLRWCCAWQTPGYILRAPAFCGRRWRQRCRSARCPAGTIDFRGFSGVDGRLQIAIIAVPVHVFLTTSKFFLSGKPPIYRFLEVRRQAVLFMANHKLLSPLLKRISAVLGCDDDGVTVIRKASDAAAA